MSIYISVISSDDYTSKDQKDYNHPSTYTYVDLHNITHDSDFFFSARGRERHVGYTCMSLPIFTFFLPEGYQQQYLPISISPAYSNRSQLL